MTGIPGGGGGGNTLALAIDAQRVIAGARLVQQGGREIEQAMAAATGAVGNFNNQSQKAAKGSNELAGQIKSLVAAFLGFQAIRQSIIILADFNQAVANIGAASGTSATKLGAITEALKEMNLSTRFSLTEVESALLGITRAGFTLQDSIGILPDALKLAAAAFGDVRTAADTTADVLKSFNLAAADSGRVADVLANLANVTAADITEIKDAIATVAPVAANFGISIEEVAAGLATLTERGLRARIGALGLKEVLIQLGPALDKSNPDRVGLTEALEKLAARQFTATEQTAIFSKEVVQVSTTLLNNVDRYKQLIDVAGRTGEATKIVSEQNDTLQFAIARVGKAATELLVTLGDQGLVKVLKEVFTVLSDSILILAGNEKAMREASDAAHTFAVVLDASLRVAAATAAGVATAAIVAFGAAVVASTGPIGALVLAIGGLVAAAGTGSDAIGDLNEEFRRFKEQAVDLKFVPQNIDLQLEKLSRASAILKLAREGKGQKSEALDSQLAVYRELERELEVVSAQGRYASISINQLSSALATPADQLLQRSWVKDSIKGLEQFYTTARQTNQIDFTATRNALREVLDAMSDEEFNAAFDNFDNLKKKAEELGQVRFKVERVVDQDKLLNNKSFIQTDAILKFIKDEIRIIQAEVDRDPETQLKLPGVKNPDKDLKAYSDKVTRTIDELIAKFGQRAKNAGNIDVFQEILNKLRDETEELKGNSLERLQNKAAIDAQNFAKQHGIELSKDQIGLVKQEAAAQHELQEEYKKAQDKIRIQKEKRDEALDLIAALQLEQDTIASTNIERERMAAHRRADEIAAKGETDEIKKLAEQIKIEADKLAQLRVFQQIADALTDPLFQAFEDLTFGLKSFSEAAKSVFIEITRGLFRSLVIEPAKAALNKLIISGINAVVAGFSGGVGAGGAGGAGDGGGSGAGSTDPTAGLGEGNTILYARGDAFSGGYGRLFSSPTVFNSPNGAKNMLGEAGEEGAFPLTRDGQGRLAIRAVGGATNTVNATVIVKANNPAEFGRSQRQMVDSLRAVSRGVLR